MFRLFYLLSILVAFGRDYLFPSDSLAQLIFIVMMVDMVVEIVLKPFSLRSPNYGVRYNFFYSSRGLFQLFSIVLIVGSFGGGVSWFAGVENFIAVAFLFILKSAYKVLNNILLYSRKYTIYYQLEFLRNVSIAITFFFADILVYCSLLALILCLNIYIYLRVKTKTCNSNSIVYGVYLQDKFLIFQSIMSSMYILFDKSLEHIQTSDLFLQYLLITKFAMFSLNIFSGFSLQIYQIDNRRMRKNVDSFMIFRANWLFILAICSGFFVFFTYIVQLLPVGERQVYSSEFIILSALWILTMLVREVFIKSSQMRGNFSIVSKLVVFVIPIHLLVVYCSQLEIVSLLTLNTVTALIIISGLYFHEYYKKGY